MSTTHERPGVYSVYSISGVVTSGERNGTAVLVAKSDGGTPVTACSLGSYQDCTEAFGQEDPMTKLAQALLNNGAARVVAIPVTSEKEYADAFALAGEQEDIRVVVCDSQTLSIQQALRDQVEQDGENQRERIALVPGAAGESAEMLAARAKELNSQRVVLTAPGAAEDETGPALVAAAVAGAICGETDPAVPLGGAVLTGVSALETRFEESDVDLLLRGGVTPVEMSGGRCTVIRGVTTRTTTGGATDETWRDLTTILVVDDVIPAVRDSLRSRFARAKNTAQTRGAIRSQVILELESKQAAEIITDYGEVTAEASEEDPTVCQVTFSFTVAHGMEQIWLSAQITV
jgi:hypothetical protein